MLLFMQVVTMFLVAITMSLALAHALEYPGKLRLDRQTYTEVQRIYYPGFTVAGAGEPLAAIATLVLLLLMRNRSADGWILAALVALIAMHAVFWTVTQPTNRYWLKDQPLRRAGSCFFATDRTNPSAPQPAEPDWTQLRSRWEYSHIVRAALATIALIALTVAIAR